ncbi:hypothetical protein TRICI_002951 [Trichomonascus ciferrii]|uniref:Uncharacterized protein n=1 Tax=Trichomonascus ciferrii TaxID=44093 RepID=A0A642VB95_9ASCO|nr:hypothetical protein TRICI_002951 [Trichomonascus ciferrii]
MSEITDIEKGPVAIESDTGPKIHRVHTSGQNNEIVHLGDTAVERDELIAALGLPFPSEPPAHGIRIGNPSPLGFAAFGLCSFVMGMLNFGVRGVELPMTLVGLCFFYGGLMQTVVAVMELIVGNTFGVIGFGSYAAFFFSYGAILTPSFGITESYGKDEHQFANAVGIYLLGWCVFSFMMWTITLRTTIELCFMFTCITLSFVLAAAAEFTGDIATKKAGGIVTILIGFTGWYLAYCEFCKTVPEIFYFRPRMTPMPGAPKTH